MNNFEKINIASMNNKELLQLSSKRHLSLNLAEMKAIREYYKKSAREATDIELECIAQTWSEHCKHKVFNSPIELRCKGKNGKMKKTLIKNLFKSTIKKATEEIARKKKGFLVSVFKDNAGIISFNKTHNICMKVETHNHPSALDPYGGANTGVGGVIRDVLGCGLGAKPIAGTDVFCFAEPDFLLDKIPKGIMHPKRIAKGVRAGVRDYGNRMGIPTVNGAICFDNRYLGNPLVYCGTVGLIPKGFEEKAAKSGDAIVVVGARTGKDGIHGATFSSAELDEEAPASAVQIGNAIEEKKFMDVLLKARELKLFNCITDCGAGGFSSAIGEMAKELGARVFLEKAPLKYKGLLPWEIFLSESQERMILSVPQPNLPKLLQLFEEENAEATEIGKFTDDKKLTLVYNAEAIGQLNMDFLHNGLPETRKKAILKLKKNKEPKFKEDDNYNSTLLKLLAMPNIASKETIIRQYDHEVQGGSILKPLVGKHMDAPGDAAIIRPILDNYSGVAISNGINPYYGDIDCYWMAASAIDEAIRNLVAVGVNPSKIALLDNFCWGNPGSPEKLGDLVKTAQGCYDSAKNFEAPFISGKDSFYNEFKSGKKTISIPPTILISALGVMGDVRKRISMDLKEEGNLIYIVGKTYNELGGSHFYASKNFIGQRVPKLNFNSAKKQYNLIFRAVKIGNNNSERIIRAMHDCSEGGLAVALAEMAFGSDFGIEIDLAKVPLGEKISRNDTILFSESNSRLLVEVPENRKKQFEKIMKGNEFSCIGKITNSEKLIIKGLDGNLVIDEKIQELKKAWKETLNW